MEYLRVQGTGTSGGRPALGHEFSRPEDLGLLLAGLAVVLLAFFLLHESRIIQRWATEGKTGAPNPDSGVFWCWIYTVLVIEIWIFAFLDLPREAGASTLRLVVIEVLREAKTMAAGLAVAGLLPMLVAIYKFLVAASFAEAIENRKFARSRTAALLGALSSALVLASSVATLIMFWESRS